MADIKEKVAAEIENIERALAELNRFEDLTKLSALELAGLGALLHNLYNSIENILKQIFILRDIVIPAGSFWHKDLLETAFTLNVLSVSSKEKLGSYLAFRHFFVHGYVLDLRADRISPLVKYSSVVFDELKKDLISQGYFQ